MISLCRIQIPIADNYIKIYLIDYVGQIKDLAYKNILFRLIILIS